MLTILENGGGRKQIDDYSDFGYNVEESLTILEIIEKEFTI